MLPAKRKNRENSISGRFKDTFAGYIWHITHLKSLYSLSKNICSGYQLDDESK